MNKERILFLVRLPPPMQGAARMNELYLGSKLLNEKYKLDYVKLNAYSSLSKMGSWFYAILGLFKVNVVLLYKLISFNPKLVYFEMAPCGSAFLRDSVYLWICKLFGKKIVCEFHGRGVEDDIKNKWRLKYNKLVLKNVQLILLSELVYYDVKDLISKKEVEFLPNGITNDISDKEFNKALKNRRSNKKLNLLYFSNMVPSKGVMDTVETCNLLNKSNIPFVCYFAGAWISDDFKKEWNDKIKKWSLEGKCIYVGPKFGDEKKEIFSKSDYLIFPTKYPRECYPLVILESFMYGVPVLSYDIGAIREIVNKKELGYISVNNDYKELYKYLLSNKDKVPDSSKIREIFKQNYTIEIAERNLYDIFKRKLKLKK